MPSRKKRLGFDARYINDRYHGIGRYAFRLLEALVVCAPEQPIVVFTGQEPDSRFDWHSLKANPNVELQAGPWPPYWPQEQARWPGILRRSRVDLLHTPNFVVPLLAQVPVVATVHDLIFDRHPEYMPMAWARPYYRFLMAAGMRRAKAVIAVSETTAADLQRFYPTPPGKVFVVPEGVEAEFCPKSEIRSADTGLRSKYRLERPFVLSVGARRPHKNQERLVQAFAHLLGQLPEAEWPLLAFAGPPDPRFPDAARQASRALGLEAHVRFLDWVPEADLSALYRLAVMLVMPSLVEGFGLPALEAMACGTPVVASARSSLPEVVGQAGLLVDPCDVDALASAMHTLLTDPALHRRLSQAGQRRAAEFSWQAAAQRTLKAYAAAGLAKEARS